MDSSLIGAIIAGAVPLGATLLWVGRLQQRALALETWKAEAEKRAEAERAKVQEHSEKLGIHEHRVTRVEGAAEELRGAHAEGDRKVNALQAAQIEQGAALGHAVEALGEIKDRLADLVDSMQEASRRQSDEMRRQTNNMLRVVASWMGKRPPDEIIEDSDPPLAPPRPSRSGQRLPSRG